MLLTFTFPFCYCEVRINLNHISQRFEHKVDGFTHRNIGIFFTNWKTEPRGGCQLPNGNLNPRVIIQDSARRTMLAATWTTDRESHATPPWCCLARVLVRFDQIELSPLKEEHWKKRNKLKPYMIPQEASCLQTISNNTFTKIDSYDQNMYKNHKELYNFTCQKKTHTPKKGHSPAIFFLT